MGDAWGDVVCEASGDALPGMVTTTTTRRTRSAEGETVGEGRAWWLQPSRSAGRAAREAASRLAFRCFGPADPSRCQPGRRSNRPGDRSAWRERRLFISRLDLLLQVQVPRASD